MDSRAFDALGRAFVGVVAGRGGGAALALPAALGPPVAAARHKKKCKPCQIRQGKKCANAPDDSVCKTDGRCLDGACNANPDCASFGESCFTERPCCSDRCQVFPISGCDVSNVGERCLVDADCGSNTCVGYVCK